MRAAPLTICAIPTSEGVPLLEPIARTGDRLAALAVDLTAISLGGMLLMLPILVLSGEGGPALVGALLMVLLFLLRAFYFPFFEINWRGQTPGKRLLRIRVVDRSGGPLRARAVVARNLLRELELFQPLSLLAAPQLYAAGLPAWAGLVAGGWALGCAALPLFNRERQRGGDLAAGTVVVRAPRLALLDDLVSGTRARCTFTAAQLEIYGTFELQTLESLLRLGDNSKNDAALLAVAQRIQRRLQWSQVDPPVEPYVFLRDFYAAQRERLEQRLLFGERRERKRETRS